MPQQLATNVENNFTGGLKTEYTGLNFPENAATDTDNCIYTIVGQVIRRPGLDYELNGAGTLVLNGANQAVADFVWNNVGGGGGDIRFYVVQIGEWLFFYNSNAATVASPLSKQILPFDGTHAVHLPLFSVNGAPVPNAVECQFFEGNGYLFVVHPYLDPFYVSYNAVAGTVAATKIYVQIRDFTGIPEGVPVNNRPNALSTEHQYNLTNQGWTSIPGWSGVSSTSVVVGTGTQTFTIQTGLTISNGTIVQIFNNGRDGFQNGAPNGLVMTGTVTSYTAGTGVLVVNVSSAWQPFVGLTFNSWTINPTSIGYISTWFSAIGNYPSNSDIWWRYKNSSGVFDPATTASNISINSGPAPKGHYILGAFNLDRTAASGSSGITAASTVIRPRTGTWFQGRAWYAGVDSSVNATGDIPYTTWTENIYFSQVAEDATQFGLCYQNNDPTSQTLFDALPTDGGVITIQGCGSIYKLFPVQNGMLVFASNGIWFITGSQGIGFSANDYTITKISAIRCISGTSFVDVLGWPLFWNEEGIYAVTPSQQGGGLTVSNLCYGTILTFFNNIPLQRKRYVKGTYDPVTFVITWVYSDKDETDITSRYSYTRALNYNTANKAFYPYTFSTGQFNSVKSVKYILGAVGTGSAPSTVKYLSSFFSGPDTRWIFCEERDTTRYVDFFSYDQVGINFVSYFVTGYKLHGQGVTKFQPIYLQMYSNVNGPNLNGYKIQGIWDYSNSRNSGKYTTIQVINNNLPGRVGVIRRRHKIRGIGLALQLKVTSVDGSPFNIIGWSSLEARNASM